MPLVYTPLGVTPHQVDDFAEGCERSVKGALHFQPESTKVITEAELKHIRAAHADFGAKLVVLDPAMKAQPIVGSAQRPLTARLKKMAGQKVSRSVAATVEKAFVSIEEKKPEAHGSEEPAKKNKNR